MMRKKHPWNNLFKPKGKQKELEIDWNVEATYGERSRRDRKTHNSNPKFTKFKGVVKP